jgi:hypothetical protein
MPLSALGAELLQFLVFGGPPVVLPDGPGPHFKGATFMGLLSLVVAFVLLMAAGCSSVSICLEQEKGVSASEDARSQGCAPNPRSR